MPHQCARSNGVTHLTAAFTVAVIAACTPTPYYIETSSSSDGGQTDDSFDGRSGSIHRGGAEQTNSAEKDSSSGGKTGEASGGGSSTPESSSPNIGGNPATASVTTTLSAGGSSASPSESGGSSAGGSTASAPSGGSSAGGSSTWGTTTTPSSGGSSSIASGGSAQGGTSTTTVAPDSSLLLRYTFDETTGTVLSDTSGNGHHGKLVTTGTGTTRFSTQSHVGSGALLFNGENSNDGAYVELPKSLIAMGATTEVTFSCWVYVNVAQAWQRVFEFGSSSTGSYLFLTVQQAVSKPNSPRFAITTSGNTAEQGIDMTTPASLTTGRWHHLVVVLGPGSPYTGTLYIDSEVVGTNTTMTLRPSVLKYTSNNWLGRSEFSGDPLYNGLLDDFRIYARALTATEVAALYAEH